MLLFLIWELGAPPPFGHSYFPLYQIPVKNLEVSGSAMEEISQFAGPDSHGHRVQLSGSGANFNMQHQSSCNLPCVRRMVKFPASEDTEQRASTARSLGDRVV